MTDWQLIEAYRTGDEDAFAVLVQKYYALVYGAACRQVSDTHLAKDIAQCVFLLFSRKLKTLSPAVAIGGWFLRTTRFVALETVRKTRHWQHMENDTVLTETMAAPSFDATGPLASLEEGILSLPAREQMCLLAKFYEGKSFKEIGAELNISEDAAEKRVARALEKLRGFFQRRGMRVSAAAIPVVLTAGFSASAHGAAVDAGTGAVIAAVKTKAVTGAATSLAAHASKALAWKQWSSLGIKLAVTLVVTGASASWYVVNRKPPVPPVAALQVTDARVGILGRGWSSVMQRASVIRHKFPNTPGAGDSSVPALRQENKSLFRDRMALTWGLRKLGEERSLRIILPEYIASGLDELLGLSPDQRAFVFGLAQQSIPPDAREDDISLALETAKPTMAAALRQVLSPRQRWRFDELCGPNAEFLLIDRTSYGRSPGFMAWQDWLGGGGIITPEEAMETVPPELW